MEIAATTHWPLSEIEDLTIVDLLAYRLLSQAQAAIAERAAAKAAFIGQVTQDGRKTYFAEKDALIESLTTFPQTLEERFGAHLAEQMRARERSGRELAARLRRQARRNRKPEGTKK